MDSKSTYKRFYNHFKDSQSKNNSNITLIRILKNENGQFEFYLQKEYENIVFEGGGSKGLVYPAAVRALSEQNKLNHVRCYAGSSAGAIIAAFCALGYKDEKLDQMIRTVDTTILLDREILSICGKATITLSTLMGASYKRKQHEGEGFINSGNNLLMKSREIIRNRFLELYQQSDETIKTKMIDYGIKHHIDINRITYSDLKYMSFLFPEQGFTDLVITATKLHGYTGLIDSQIYFNIIDTPHAEIAFSILISSSIPYIFKRQRYLGDYFIDGGVTNNLPFNFFLTRKEFAGETLALAFERTKKEKQPTPKFKKQKMPKFKSRDWMIDCLSGGNIDSSDWAEYRFTHQDVKHWLPNQGINVIHVAPGDLTTMSFDASPETIEEARIEAKNKIIEIFSNDNFNSIQGDELNPDKINYFNEIVNYLTKESQPTIYFCGKKIDKYEMMNRYKNKIIGVLNNIIGGISPLNFHNLDKIENSYKIEEFEKEMQKEKARYNRLTRDLLDYQKLMINHIASYDQIKAFNLEKNNPFKWLYDEINKSIILDKNNEDIVQWLIEILNYASPIDIVFNLGTLLLDKTVLYAKNIKYRTTEQKQLFLTKSEIIKKLSTSLANHYGYNNHFQLHDAMGEFYKKITIGMHYHYFHNSKALTNEPYIQKIIQSNHVINDILSLNRFIDLKLIQYNEKIFSQSSRSNLITQFINEIKESNPFWITDLMICKKLIDYFKSNADLQSKYINLANNTHYNKKRLRPYALYIQDAYASYFHINLDDKSDNWKNECSAIVKIITNSKLSSNLSTRCNSLGHIDIIISDLANEILFYLKSLKLNIEDISTRKNDASQDLEVFSNQLEIPEFILLPIDNNNDKWIIESKIERLKLTKTNTSTNTKVKSEIDSITDLKFETLFDTRIMNQLLTYINQHPYTWYSDLFSMNNALEFKENPLITLLSDSKSSREICLSVLIELQKLHYKQLENIEKLIYPQDYNDIQDKENIYLKNNNNEKIEISRFI